jgi:hypothetical protein
MVQEQAADQPHREERKKSRGKGENETDAMKFKEGISSMG